VLAPAGTGAVMELTLQLIGVTALPLNVTVPEPRLDPNPVPVTTTSVPTVPADGERVAMVGTTVKFTALLTIPPTVTSRFPLVAAVGTGTMIDPALQLVDVAMAPLNVTRPALCVDPKFVPVIVTTVPTFADDVDTPEMFGVGRTVNTAVLLDSELVVTTTFPALAPPGTRTEITVGLQEIATAWIPSNVTTPAEPKLPPFTATLVPAGPIDGDRLVMLGKTVMDAELVTVPAAVFTTTGTIPGFARPGRVTTMDVSFQLKIAAMTPPIVTAC